MAIDHEYHFRILNSKTLAIYFGYPGHEKTHIHTITILDTGSRIYREPSGRPMKDISGWSTSWGETWGGLVMKPTWSNHDGNTWLDQDGWIINKIRMMDETRKMMNHGGTMILTIQLHFKWCRSIVFTHFFNINKSLWSSSASEVYYLDDPGIVGGCLEVYGKPIRIGILRKLIESLATVWESILSKCMAKKRKTHYFDWL